MKIENLEYDFLFYIYKKMYLYLLLVHLFKYRYIAYGFMFILPVRRRAIQQTEKTIKIEVI